MLLPGAIQWSQVRIIFIFLLKCSRNCLEILYSFVCIQICYFIQLWYCFRFQDTKSLKCRSNSFCSRRYLRETLKMANAEDLNRLTSCSLVLLGHIFLSLGNSREAMNMVTPAMQLASKIPDVHIQLWASAILKGYTLLKFYNIIIII